LLISLFAFDVAVKDFVSFDGLTAAEHSASNWAPDFAQTVRHEPSRLVGNSKNVKYIHWFSGWSIGKGGIMAGNLYFKRLTPR
jgi:hypothetical protein